MSTIAPRVLDAVRTAIPVSVAATRQRAISRPRLFSTGSQNSFRPLGGARISCRAKSRRPIRNAHHFYFTSLSITTQNSAVSRRQAPAAPRAQVRERAQPGPGPRKPSRLFCFHSTITTVCCHTSSSTTITPQTMRVPDADTTSAATMTGIPTSVPCPHTEQFHLKNDSGELYTIQLSWPLHWQESRSEQRGNLPVL